MFLAAHEPHGKAELAGFDPGKKDEWVKERTLRFGGIPEKLLNNPAFWRMYLPVFRADYEMIWKYDFGKLDLRTEIPAEIFYSEEDTTSSSWSTTGKWPGGSGGGFYDF